MVRETLGEANRRNSDNIQELAELFPISRNTSGRDLRVQQQELSQNGDQPVDEMEPGDGQAGEAPGPGGVPGTDGGDDRSGGADARRAAPRPRGVRVLRGGPRDLMMRFTTPQDAGTVRLGLRAAGEQYQRRETPIMVEEAVQVGDITATARVESGQIVVEAPPNTQVEIMISLAEDDQHYHSYRLALAGETP